MKIKLTNNVKSETAPEYLTSNRKKIKDINFNSEDDIIKEAINILKKRVFERKSDILNSVDSVKQYLQINLCQEKNEIFCALWLDNKHRVIDMDILFNGTIDSSTVHIRPVLQKSLERNAAAVIFAHNHPSGITNPSQSDIDITRKLSESLRIIDVRVLDHFIIGEDVTSLVELGYSW